MPELTTEEFRAWHEADYRRRFVTLAGLAPLAEGVNTVGSAASNAVVLPASSPALAGRFVVSRDGVTFEPHAGAAVSMDSKPVRSPVQVKSDGDAGGPDELTVGDGVSMWVHLSGDRRTVRIRDEHGEAARAFKGFQWFPIDPKFRVVGRFVRDREPSRVRIPNLAGDIETYTTEGVVEFAINGEPFALRPMTTKSGRLYFIFRDGTSGKETYGAARFLYTDLGADGTVLMDFNQAYHPPCAFNPFTTCPLPPPENRLTLRIPAGERT